MQIDRVITGSLEENCYILGIEDKVLVIDPGDDIDKINKVINNRKVLGVLITHRHFDHVGALDELSKNYNAKVYDRNNLEEKRYDIDGYKFEIIYTPGHKSHSSDSISFYFKKENIFFCGDFIFYESIGRCDLPTGDYKIMKESLNKIKNYPLDMLIYPGHGRETTLEYEIENNIYFSEV